METTENAFLGGRLQILQPKHGYRAGADPVLLAAGVEARPGASVLDLGCGVGTAMLCLKARIPDVTVVGVEVRSDLAALANLNLRNNGMAGTVFVSDLRALPPALRERRFDHVITNPPFFDRTAGRPAREAGREQGRGGDIGLDDWLDIALRRLNDGGQLTLINRIESLPKCLLLLGKRAGSVTVLPLAPRSAQPARLFLLTAKKGARGAFALMPPFVLHVGSRHTADAESYTPRAQEVLRNGAAIPLKI